MTPRNNVDLDAPALWARQPVIGSGLSGVTEPGDEPVKIGGVASLVTPASAANGQRKDLWVGSFGQIMAALGSGGGADSVTANALLPFDAGGSGRVLAAGDYVFNGATWDRLRTALVFKTFASTAITAGTGATIWTPGAGKKFRLMGWLISTSVAGQLIFGDNLVATVIARSEAVAAAGVSKVESLGNGILSALANNVLKLDGPTGNVAGMVWGTEE